MSATSSDETGSSSDERVGELLVRELRWIHGLLRRDLEVVRRDRSC